MPRRVAIDSGPLAGLFNRDDTVHEEAKSFFATFKDSGFITVAVVTEVMYLLDFDQRAQLSFLRWINSGALEVVNLEDPDWKRIEDLTHKYSDLPADFADATLVAVSERLGTRQVASIDREFSIYRFKDRHPFENLFRRH